MENKSFEMKFTVPFHELDPMQIMWHGNYLKYFDITRSALFANLGVDLYKIFEDSKFLFPVIKSSAKYIYSLRYKDEFICKATLKEAKFKIVVDFEIRLCSDNRICTRGRGEQVAIKMPENELLLKIPAEISAALLS